MITEIRAGLLAYETSGGSLRVLGEAFWCLFNTVLKESMGLAWLARLR